MGDDVLDEGEAAALVVIQLAPTGTAHCTMLKDKGVRTANRRTRSVVVNDVSTRRCWAMNETMLDGSVANSSASP